MANGANNDYRRRRVYSDSEAPSPVIRRAFLVLEICFGNSLRDPIVSESCLETTRLENCYFDAHRVCTGMGERAVNRLNRSNNNYRCWPNWIEESFCFTTVFVWNNCRERVTYTVITDGKSRKRGYKNLVLNFIFWNWNCVVTMWPKWNFLYLHSNMKCPTNGVLKSITFDDDE